MTETPRNKAPLRKTHPMTRGWIARLGALVVVLEGIQQLKKYAQNALLWVKGRSLEA